MADDGAKPGPDAPPAAPPTAAPAAGEPAPAAVTEAEPTPEQIEQAEHAALAEASVQFPFGPAFFMTHLRAFVAETCDTPGARLPVVEIHLGDGEVLELCHIIGVTPALVALAVNEADADMSTPRLRTDFVPYGAIARVTVRPSRPESPRLGFDRSRMPRVMNPQPAPEMTPEEAIKAAAAMPPGTSRPAS